MAAFMITFMSVGIFTLMSAVVILRGYVLSILWGWIIVPIFGLPTIGVAQAIGISIVVSLMTHQYVPSKDKEVWMPIITSILTLVFALVTGSVVRLWL